MSIRLRLTLLYSAIVALILIIFSLVLYLGQSQATYRDIQQRLADRARIVAQGGQPQPPDNVGQPPPPPGGVAQPPPPLLPPEPERYYVQILDAAGEVTRTAVDLEETLPLSEAGLDAVTGGLPWNETAVINDERFLIHSRWVRGPEGTGQIVQVAGSLARRDSDLAYLRNFLVIGSCLTVLIAFGAGWMMAGLALRPIKRITHTAQAIGAEQNFSRRIDHSGPNDELGQLATTFNDMLGKLQAAYQQIAQSLQAQRRFVADASHELRTPLTTIRGNIGLLQREPPIGAEDRADVLSDTVNETERLMRLINNLLTLARADTQQPARREPVAVKPLLKDVCGQVKRLAPQRTIVCNPVGETTIIGDPDALKQVLLILSDNALKHTPPEAGLTLSSAEVGEHVTLSVADNGPGIDPVRLPHIFDRFYRGDDSRTGPGTGLGLAIAKELTEAQNGTISVKSELGRGSVFTLTFPKS
jgi:signal transduction histidine kinase